MSLKNAFDRFNVCGNQVILQYTDGGYAAALFRFGYVWTWVVFRDDEVVGGRCDRVLNAGDAAAEALECMIAARNKDRIAAGEPIGVEVGP
jgi:hypothetical protein